MQSRQQIMSRALRELGVIGAGQSPAAEDAQTVYSEMSPVYADLAKREIWVWGDSDKVDDEASIHIAIILANSVARQFGVAPDEGKRLMAENRLKQLLNRDDAGDPIRANYF